MNSIRNRARDYFPSVLLTLVSIIQAIALESLADRARDRPELYETSWDALLGWLQLAVSFNIIILIWLIYVGFVMRFRWTPTVTDSVMPFFVGLIEFSMIELIGHEKLGEWVLTLGLVSAVVTILAHRLMRRARSDPENRQFFDGVPRATLRDHAPQIITVIFSAVAGAWLWYSRDYGWFALVILLIALIATAYNAYLQSKFWRASIGTS